mmetsp:Transcript_23930/g.57169  ORF Transcript_23930/g.57169 Transcript_23930/m.57169 type:complete len:240 (+) Transcript_23930:249-968(+)
MHEGLVGLALAALGPPLAALVVVVAHRHADPARVRALLHHREGVVDALARIGPDLALRRVLVGALDALTHAAAVRALLVHEAGVLEALAVGRPARAVGLDVLAGGLACLARHRAGADHELGVGVALARGAPAGALLVDVLALGRAQPAAGRAEPKHRVRVFLALTSGGPRAAGGVRVVARVCADAAGQGALDRHEFRVVSHALVIPGPVRAVGALVVADTGGHSRDGQGEGEQLHHLCR